MEGNFRGLIEVLSWNLPDETEENRETFVGTAMSRPRFEQSTSQIEVERYRYITLLGRLILKYVLQIICQ